ncbi:hypothetical protein TRICI_006764 [Trichomonascus ciferrii]|uniref:Protein DSF2 n=1 Tax=Trichomonascus ciferrii TaxID=44093 RepID=A0A642UDS2_9ASCO|nr:hypothetical protein TRICI_006764 [Trichomonascus ciferrii]
MGDSDQQQQQNKAFTQDMSPLDLLEQKSRRLAHKLHDRPGGDDSRMSISSVSTTASRQPSNASTRSRRIRVQEGDEWTPDARASYVSRAGSVSSVASFGGILDSFRLSSLPVAELQQGADDPSEQNNTTNNDWENDEDDDSDTSTIQGSPTQSAHPPLERVQSPASSVASDDTASSVYTASSHISQRTATRPATINTQQQHHARASGVHPPATRASPSQYYFPDVLSKHHHHAPRAPAHPPSASSNITSSRQASSHHHPSLLTPPALRPRSDDPALAKRFKDMTLEDHVTAGIALHEKGDLREASYHWQHAAFKGDHTAMLLYGLAVRHGWGMRQNASEAVKWLRKAMESSLGDNSKTFDLKSPGSVLPAIMSEEKQDHKTSSLKKAHIGLALYELGMSYLHSWGTEKDEDMALRAFELAGSLGDSDALCEAAGLYMKNGPKGRKKDLQKAARLYREAADTGANMIGQSWIYKDKYMGEDKKKKGKK